MINNIGDQALAFINLSKDLFIWVNGKMMCTKEKEYLFRGIIRDIRGR